MEDGRRGVVTQSCALGRVKFLFPLPRRGGNTESAPSKLGAPGTTGVPCKSFEARRIAVECFLSHRLVLQTQDFGTMDDADAWNKIDPTLYRYFPRR